MSFRIRLQDPDRLTSSKIDGGDVIAAVTRPSWIQRHFFVVFLAASLLFHIAFVTIVSFFDFRWVAPWMSLKELPVELVNEEQVQKEQKKAGFEDAKGATATNIGQTGRSATPKTQSTGGRTKTETTE